jgi:hypothetical protein
LRQKPIDTQRGETVGMGSRHDAGCVSPPQETAILALGVARATSVAPLAMALPSARFRPIPAASVRFCLGASNDAASSGRTHQARASIDAFSVP